MYGKGKGRPWESEIKKMKNKRWEREVESERGGELKN
jgi:hypothetical protein